MPIVLHHIEPAIPNKSRKVKQNDKEFKDAAENFPDYTDAIDASVILPSLQ